MRRFKFVSGFALLLAAVITVVPIASRESAAIDLSFGQQEFPKTDFARHSVDLDEIKDIVNRDWIPAVDNPKFVPIADVPDIGDQEPVVTLSLNGEVRAYPLRILTWHEIVNDRVGGVPVTVTYCPLCNSAIAFERTVAGVVLDFGVSGRLRNSDLVMYDRQTESWWQQFTGEALVGHYTGTMLKMLPVRVESYIRFQERSPQGVVMVPKNPGMRLYGTNPYEFYDRRGSPYSRMFRGPFPDGIAPLSRVVQVGEEAWSLDLVREKGIVQTDDLIITWQPGQASALDSMFIAQGRDVGNVVVQRVTEGVLKDAVYDVNFAFAFHAFYPDGVIHLE